MPGFPGDALLGRLWDSLIGNGIGLFIKPGQMRREGLVGLELKRAELLTLAQTQRDIDDIKSGQKDLSDFKLSLGFAAEHKVADGLIARTEPVIDMVKALEIAKVNLQGDAVRREINTSKAIIHAEESLIDDASPLPDETVDEDWLYRWRDYSGEVSRDDLQKLWGRLLAGEIKSPGTYSLRCLDFLRNLSDSEVRLIADISKYILQGVVWRADDLSFMPIKFSRLLELQELGVLAGVESTGIHLRLTRTPDESKWLNVFSAYQKCLVIRSNNIDAELQIQIYKVTQLGRQIVELGDFKPDHEYLIGFGRFIAAQGFDVKMADLAKSSPGFTSWENERELSEVAIQE